MDRIEIYPSRGRLFAATALGLALLAVGTRLWQVFGTQSGGPSLAWFWPALFFAGGLVTALRALIALVSPRPSFACDGHGFSVMGRKSRPWTDLASVSVRSVSVGFIPAARWVSFRYRKTATGRAGRVDIPWTHLPASAEATARHVEKLAVSYRARRKAPPPTYDPYDPAALAEARARAY